MYKQPSSEPIAIVGSGCRFAGQATSPSKLWQVLANPPDLSKQVPSKRFNANAFYHKDGEHHGTTNSIMAYWLEQDHRVFDTAFFNITPKEAEAIDPQQRLLLEVVYEAMESAGYTLTQYAGKNVGVFAGVMTADYDTLSQRDELSASQYYATGNARSIISNRVSYFFNFRGPSMTIDTACSSSLVALHQAVLSLRSGEIPIACVTGVNLMITPEQFIVESSLHMLSPTGKCRMWDQSADGYARGEGVAAIFMKPLSLALQDGDDILGLIRQTGVNSDGRTPGITMPNPDAQASLIQNTYITSGLDPRKLEDRCQYFEAHGTGTQAGDPREAQAIQEAFFGVSGNNNPDSKLLVGSIKTVIGHTEGAAGLAGLLKVLQAMRHGSVPPNLHFERLNPAVEPFYHNLEIPKYLTPWPRPSEGQPKRASVNSFGFGGTNSHAIIEEYIPELHNFAARRYSGRSQRQSLDLVVRRDPSPGMPNAILPIMLSASSQKSLREVIRSWKEYLQQSPDVSLTELAWNLFRFRTPFPYRVSVTASSATQAIELLESLVNQSSSTAEIGVRPMVATRNPSILGIFTGQGAQWSTMSRLLLLSNKRYSETIQQLENVLQQSPDPPSWSLKQQIMAEASNSRLQEAAVAQPVSTALQIGLVDLLNSLGVKFKAVVGHSSGEIAAAYAAGRLSARDAMLISYYRGLYANLAGGTNDEKGGMMAAGLTEAEALTFCRDSMFGGKICVAASNAPSSVTLSGDLDVIHLAKKKLSEQNVFARLLQVDTAYHSPHMIRPADAYTEALKKCNISPMPATSKIQWISSVHGFNQKTEKDLASSYWRDNMVCAVQFHDAIRTVFSTCGPFDCAIEVGPHPALKGPVNQTSKAILGAAIPHYGVIERSKDDAVAFSEFLGSLWCQFGPSAIDLEQYIGQSSDPSVVDTRLADMPTYRWDHSQIHYRESRISRQYHFKQSAPHELLGTRTRDDNEFELRWRSILRPEKLPWLEGHSFQGQALVPASAYCVMAFDAAIQFLGGRAASVVEILDLNIMSGISMEHDSVGTEVLFSLIVLDQPRERVTRGLINASFTITSCPADGSTAMKKNASGNLSIVLDKPNVDALPHRQASLAETLPASTDGFYAMMDGTGLVYTGPFKALQTIQRRCNFASTTLRRRHSEDTSSLAVSPATLDSCLQSAFLTWSSPGDKSLWTSFLPTRIAKIQFNVALCGKRPKTEDQCMMRVDTHLTNVCGSAPDSKATFTTEVCIYNENNEMEIAIEGLTVAAIAHARPEEDHELYLHTAMDLDPTDEIVLPIAANADSHQPELVEICERIASFYSTSLEEVVVGQDVSDSLAQQNKRSSSTRLSYPSDTAEHIDHLVATSPLRESLKLLQDMGRVMPALLPSALPLIIKEARFQLNLGRHVERITRQLCHRYPRMTALSIMDSKVNMAECVLQGLGTSFLSLTKATLGTDGQPPIDLLPDSNGKVHHRHIRLDEDILAQLSSTSRADLVVITSSALGGANVQASLNSIRGSMNDGGFLVLIQATESPLKKALSTLTQPDCLKDSHFSPETEKGLLESCGFVSVARNSDQTFAPGFSISVRQAGAAFVNHIARPLTCTPVLTSEKLLIVGVASQKNCEIGHGVQRRLSPFCGSIELARSIENMDLDALHGYTSAIVLEDIESPVVSNMTHRKLAQLKDLFHPNMNVLWLTHHARFQNPEHAATLGFTRTVSAEVPNFKLQVLDLDEFDGSDALIAETFLRLIAAEPPADKSLWIREPEIYMENGRRLVPRVLPLKKLNDRANALRRVVTKPLNTINQTVEIIPSRSDDGFSREVIGCTLAQRQAYHHGAGKTTLRVIHSTLEAVRLGTEDFAYVCLGQDLVSGETKLALSARNASYIEVSASLAIVLPEISMTGPHFVHSVTQYLAALSVFEQSTGDQQKHIVFIDADPLLVQCAKTVAEARAARLSAWTTDCTKIPQAFDSIQLHSRFSDRQLKAMMPADGAIIYDFSFGRELSQRLAVVLPGNCEYYPGSVLLGTQQRVGNLGSGSNTNTSQTLELAIALATKTADITRKTTTEILSVNEAIVTTELLSSTNIIDWTADRNTAEIVKPLVEQQLFDPHKTYVLVGLTRDFGQSLSRLFLEHGARHIVLASRNPDMSPKWCEELRQVYGAQVIIEKLNVTGLDEVMQFKGRISETMPPVGGIINGAMVLEDRVFAQMTVETWNRVMRPKTVGSKNLDSAFSDSSLDFFIMTSSFAAIGGHPGQSNYAAANMYMNGLAADRRRRGLTGSVLNIGVIYGLGLLQREKEELYVGLEREGYPPISERDIHHMFLEAIVAGRPGHSEPFDITTGLRRFKWGSANPLHWHLDPRFNHFTVDDDTLETDPASVSQGSLLDQLSSIDNLDLMTGCLVAAFSEHLRIMLQLPEGSINHHSSLSEIGIDSLVAVDIRNWIWKTLRRDVAVMKVLGASSIHRFCLDIAEQIYSEMNAAEDSSNADTPLTSRTPSEASGPSSIGTSTGWVENQISKLDGGQC